MDWRIAAIRESVNKNDIAVTDRLARLLLGLDGGPGSGNFGHSGRPGKRGGSAKGSGGGEFRTKSGETSSGYIGIQKTKAFKGIVRAAQNSKDFDSFIDSLDHAQLDLIRQQRQQCGTKESLSDYTERMRLMMGAKKPEKVPENHIVEGKDITRDLKRFDGTPYVDPKFGQVIDTEIEDVLVKQGFNGVPKVVSQEEFDKIISENPEMPILYRSYSAPNADVLQDYDDMLEKGEWYVDCGTGGAQYGQGMYCAGVYQQEALYDWNDPKFEPDDNGWSVFTINQEGYKAIPVDQKENTEAGDLYVDVPYLMIDKDGNRKIVKQDMDSLLFLDDKGGIVDESEITDALHTGKVFECKETDIGIYKDAYDKERKKGIEGALSEMEHYRHLSEGRCYENYEPMLAPNEAYEDNGGQHGFWIFEKDQMKSMKDEKPQEGQEIAVTFYDEDGIPIRTRTGIYYDGDLVYPDMLAQAHVGVKDEWTPITRKDKKEDLAPQSSTRMMTMDPSSKIITSDDLKLLKRQVAVDRAMEDVGKWAEERGQKDLFDKAAEVHELSRKYEDASHVFEGLSDHETSQVWEMAKTIDKITGNYLWQLPRDDGVFAAAMGYDAINAEGHGSSGSYTVVLNRTKVIISKNRVHV